MLIGSPSEDVSCIFIPPTGNWGITSEVSVLTEETIECEKDLPARNSLSEETPLNVFLSINVELSKVAVLIRVLPMSITRFNPVCDESAEVSKLHLHALMTTSIKSSAID